jgi:hypothetical protein
MASNDKNKHKVVGEAESSAAVKKRLRFSDNGGSDDSSSELEEETEAEMKEEETEEDEVSLHESLMNQLKTFEEKLMAKCSRDLFFIDDGDTSSTESKPCSPEMPSNRMCSNPDDNCHTQFLDQNQILIACVARNNIATHTDRYSDYNMPNVTNKVFIIARILSYKRLIDSHESKTMEGSIIHRNMQLEKCKPRTPH